MGGIFLEASETAPAGLSLGLSDLFFRLDRQGRILDCQGGSSADLILPRVSLIGKRIHRVPDRKLAATLAQALLQVSGTRSGCAFEYALSIQGEERRFTIQLLPVLESQLIAVVRNVSQSRAVEEELRARAEQFVRQQAALHELTLASGKHPAGALSKILEGVSATLGVQRVGIWLRSGDGSALMLECLYDAGRILERPRSALSAARHPRFFEAVETSRAVVVYDAREDPRTSELHESYLSHNDVSSILGVGVRREGEVAGVLLVENLGSPRAWSIEEEQFAASIADLVSLSLAAAERASLEAELEQSQKMEAVGVLAGGVAHDFNNLLTVIRGYSELQLRGTHDGDPLRGQGQQVLKACEKAEGLVRQLLAFSRKQVLSPTTFDLNRVIWDMEGMLRRIVGEDVELLFAPQSDPNAVHADRGQLEQVLMNLVANGRDAMPGGGRLVIETSVLEVELYAAHEHPGLSAGRYVVLTVSDTGQGMDAATQARIFEPFFTTKDKGRGTGLGLATVYGIVQQSGGHIEVFSEVGAGTTFRIYLPWKEGWAPADDSSASIPSADAPRGTEVILLVEDDESVRTLALDVLQGQGYQVLEATGGPQALRLVEDHPGAIDLMISDVIMPGMNGPEIYERVSRLRPGLRVLYMSGYADDSVAEHGVHDPEASFLQKPFSIDGLAQKVREVLGQR
jgi:signal transduction histidine kinase